MGTTNAILDNAAQAIQQSPPQSDQGQQVLEGLALSEQQGRIQNAAETFNLASELDDGLLEEIGKECYKGFRDDEDSRAEWLDMHTFWMSLYMQQDYAENSDQDRDWGATESVPILTEACNQFQARTYKTFFPSDTFISAIPLRKNIEDRAQLEQRAERVANHMSWQLGYQDRSYKPDKDALFLGAAQHGSFFTKTYFKEKIKRFKVDNVRPTDLVVNYNVGPVRIEDTRRKSHIIYTTVGDTQRLVSGGYFTKPFQSCEQDGSNAYNVRVDEVQGILPPNMTLRFDKPAIAIEQHLWLDIDDSGQFHPYIVTFDLANKKVRRMTIGYEASPDGTPLKDYEQIQYFTHYKYQENPDGFYGLGLGHMIGDLNSACNIMLRQTMDAATLANDGNMSGFVSERLGLEGDEIRMVIGKFTKIPDTVGDLQNSMMPMNFPGPNSALLEIMEAMDQRAQRMASTTEATTGAVDRNVQPTTYLAQIEQSLEQFSSVQMRLANSLTDELQKIYRINQKYMPLIDYYMVNEAPEIITRSDYADDMMIAPIFDPKFTTQAQKVARAQSITQVVMENPLTAQRPQVMDELTRRMLEALEADNIDELVPPNMPPASINDQMQENMQFMMPQPPGFDVYPDHDHAKHLAEMEPFIKQYGDKIPPENQQAVIAHKQKHEAFLYGIQHGIIPPPAKAGQIGASPLAQGQGNAMGNGTTSGAIPGAQALPIGAIMGAGAPPGGQPAGH